MKSLEEIRKIPSLHINSIGFDGGNGWITINGILASVIWSNGGGWEHVSVAPRNRKITFSWEQMCKLKALFFNDDEVCVEYHPANSEYVNNVKNCLHIWRPINEILPTPPSWMVGFVGTERTDNDK